MEMTFFLKPQETSSSSFNLLLALCDDLLPLLGRHRLRPLTLWHLVLVGLEVLARLDEGLRGTHSAKGFDHFLDGVEILAHATHVNGQHLLLIWLRLRIEELLQQLLHLL